MILIKQTLTQPPEVGKRKWRECTKAGYEAMGRFWHKNYLSDHFNRAANTKYQHQPRKVKYLKNKQRGGRRKVDGVWITIQYGGQVDNVYSGRLESLMKSPAVIQAFPTRVNVKMVGPRYVSMRPWKSGQPNKGREISTVTEEQQTQLEKVLIEVTNKRLAEWKSPRTIAI